MSHFKFLERFDEGGHAIEKTAPLPQDLPGYDAGYADGLAAAAAQQASLSESLIARINELQFSHAEAQHYVMASLNPLLHALLNQVLADIVPDLTKANLIGALTEAAQNDLSAPLCITVHPDQMAAIQSALLAFPDIGAQLAVDASLQADDILLIAQGQETALNVAGFIDDIRTALASIVQNEGKESHG